LARENAAAHSFCDRNILIRRQPERERGGAMRLRPVVSFVAAFLLAQPGTARTAARRGTSPSVECGDSAALGHVVLGHHLDADECKDNEAHNGNDDAEHGKTLRGGYRPIPMTL